MTFTITLVTGFITLAVAALSFLLDQFTQRQITRDLEHGRASYLNWQQQKHRVMRDRAESESQLAMLAAAVAATDTAAVGAIVRDLAADDDPGTAMWVLDPNGTVIASTRPLPRGRVSVADRAGTRDAAAGSVVDTVWTTDGVELVAMSPIRRGDAVVGILALTERVGLATARTIAQATSRDVTVLADDRVVAHVVRDQDSGDEDAAVVSSLAYAIRDAAIEARRATPRGDGRLLEVTDARERHVGLVLPLHADGGTLVLSRGLFEIDELSLLAWQQLLLAGGVIAGLGILGSLRTAWRLTRPLGELTAATARMAAGSLTARVAVTGNDEIGRLGSAFNEMASRIGGLIDDVRRQADRAAAANRATDSFLASMSHELRTPITNITAYGELLQQFGADAEPHERDEFLGIIRQESTRLAYLVDQIMDFTRLESDQVRWHDAVHDLREDVTQALRTWQPHAGTRDVRFAVQLPAVRVPVHADGNEITRMVGKLLHNAVNFSPRGGRVEVRLDADAGAFTLSVRDHGPGIPDEVKAKVFDRFFQHGNTLTAKPPGTGLGLTIARLIADHHRHAIHCLDAAGGGACFTVTGRLATTAAATPPAAPAAAAAPACP